MVGGSKSRPSAPSSFAYSAHFFAVCHPVPCAPAMTITRPATAFTATWMTLRRSSSVSASYSPRDPFGPTPRHPLFIRKSQCSANLSKSTARPAGAEASSLNARVVATTTPPRSISRLVMVSLSLIFMACRFSEFTEPKWESYGSTVRVRVIHEWDVLRKRAQQVFNGAPAHPALTYPKPGAATQLQCAEGLRLCAARHRAQGAAVHLFAAADHRCIVEPFSPAWLDAVSHLDAVREAGKDAAAAGSAGTGSAAR